MKTDYSIRTATPEDAKALVAIYDYYVKETAITFEYETPSVEEFRGRIEKVLTKYPYIVVERTISENEIVLYCTAVNQVGFSIALKKA